MMDANRIELCHQRSMYTFNGLVSVQAVILCTLKLRTTVNMFNVSTKCVNKTATIRSIVSPFDKTVNCFFFEATECKKKNI